MKEHGTMRLPCQSLTLRQLVRTSFHRVFLALSVVCLCVSFAKSAHAVGYTTTFIDYPDALNTEVKGINNAGLMVGDFGNSQLNHAFVTDGVSYTPIIVPGASAEQAYGINNNGQIVGLYNSPDGLTSHGFLLDGSGFTTFDVPGATSTVPTGINDAGQIVGSFTQPGFDQPQAFLKNGDSFLTFTVPGVLNSSAWGINNAGQIVGTFSPGVNGFNASGFLTTDGVNFSYINYPITPGGFAQTAAFGINNLGDIVGFYDDTSGGRHGFLDTGGVFSTFDIAGARNLSFLGINDSGAIAGTYIPFSGPSSGFLMTPVSSIPEPSTVLLLGLGLLGLTAWQWKRQGTTHA